MVKRALLFAALLPAAAPAGAFVRLYPVFGADLMLGQHFFEGQSSAVGGNLDLRAVPAIKFNENFVLIPTLAASYQGTKDVGELAGGAQLFQDSLTMSAHLKPVLRVGRLKLKPQAGYRLDWLRETENESLGSGLFDYSKTSAGLEAEWIVTPEKWVSLGADLYQLRFPNYESLESQVDAGLGRQNRGAKTLDSDNRALSGAWNTDTPFPRTRMTVAGTLLERGYPEQHVVTEGGQLATNLREDSSRSVSGSLNWTKGWNKLAASVSFGGSWLELSSDQNQFDARTATYLPDYYSYGEVSLRPTLELALKGKGSFSLSYGWTRREYDERLIQDAEGAYLSDKVWIRSQSVSMGVAVPVGMGLKIVVRTQLTRSDSNQKYEKVFATNYNLSSHLLGLSWEY